MKVRAIAVGYYGDVLRTPGTSSADFEIKDKSELGKWMVRLDDKGNPIDEKTKQTETKEQKDARVMAEKIAKLKADLETARAKGDDKGVAHAAGELSKLDPDAGKAAQLEILKGQLAEAESKKDTKEIERLNAKIAELDPSTDLT